MISIDRNLENSRFQTTTRAIEKNGRRSSKLILRHINYRVSLIISYDTRLGKDLAGLASTHRSLFLA